jgi:hypothetical protein
MSLLFRYRRVPILHPAVALGGGLYRPRPLVLVTLLSGSNTAIANGLLDSGADDTVFPGSVALRLGLDLSNALLGEATGIAASAVPVRYAQVALRLTDGHEFCEWSALVGFTTVPLRHPVLGFAGCLHFFDADFRGEREEVDLAIKQPLSWSLWLARPVKQGLG